MLAENVPVSEEALASSQIPDLHIPYSKGDLNGYAVEMEQRLMDQEPLVVAGEQLYDLVVNPERFGEFTQVYMQQMLQVPGGVDITTNVYGPILAQVNAADPRIQSLRQHQNSQPQPQPQQQPAAGNGQIVWDDGGMPLPAVGQQNQPDVSGMIASGNGPASWVAVDNLARSGHFTTKPLVQF